MCWQIEVGFTNDNIMKWIHNWQPQIDQLDLFRIGRQDQDLFSFKREQSFLGYIKIQIPWFNAREQSIKQNTDLFTMYKKVIFHWQICYLFHMVLDWFSLVDTSALSAKKVGIVLFICQVKDKTKYCNDKQKWRLMEPLFKVENEYILNIYIITVTSIA